MAAESRQEQIDRLTQEFIWFADHQPYPHPDPRVHALAVDIMRRADELARKENLRVGLSTSSHQREDVDVGSGNVVFFPGAARAPRPARR
jgi:hypothetical protein